MARVQGMTPEGIRKLIAEAVSFIKDLNVEDLNKLLAAFEDANGIFDVRLVEAQEAVKAAGDKALEAEEQARLIVDELAKYEQAQAEEAARILGEVAVAIDAANLASAKVPDLLARLELAEKSVSAANAEVEKFITKQDEFLAISQEQVTKVSELNSGFQELNQAVDESVTKVDAANANLSLVSADLDAAKASLDAKMKQNELDISAAQEVADSNQNAISDLNRDLSSLSTKHETLTSNFSAEVEKLETADASLITNMNTKVGELNATTAAQSTAISAAKAQADKGVSDASAASFALANYKTVNDPRVAQAQKDADKGIEDASAALTRANTAAGQLPAMNTAISNAAAAAKKANDSLPAIRTDITGLTTSIGTATGKLTSLQSDVDSKVADLQAMDQSQAQGITKAQADATKAIGDAKAAADKLPAMVTATSNAAAAAKKANDALPTIRTDISNVSTRISTATGNLTSLESDVASKVAALQAMDQSQAGEISTTNSKIDNLEIGGRNLLLDSNPKTGQGSAYPWGRFFLTDSLAEGDTVTISLKGTLPEGRTAWRFFNSGGMIPVANLVAPDPSGITTWTGTWSIKSSANNYLTVYGARNDAEHGAFPGETYIEWIKLERGSKATDWTPAPEDVDADIAKAQLEAETARAEAESKSNAARVAAELAAKELADQAQADAEVEAARAALEIAQKEAKAAKDAAAIDATEKADAAQDAAETLAKAEAKAAKETAEANAAIDATTKANKAKTDAEAKAATLATAAKDAAATALNTYKGVNDPKVTKAQTDATKAIGDAKAAADKLPAMVTATANAAAAAKKANDALPALSSGISTLTRDLATASGNLTGLEQNVSSKITALEAMDATQAGEISTAKLQADKGVQDAKEIRDTVYSSVESGASLVAYLPGTETPIWAQNMEDAPASENPDGLKEAYIWSSMAGSVLAKNVAVTPGAEYRITVWLKADKPNSRIYLELRDQDGAHAVRTGAVGGGGTYLIGNMTMPTEWTKYETVMRLRDNVQRVRIGARYHNHANGTERNAVQYVADLRVDPVIPLQGDVEKAQRDATKGIADAKAVDDKLPSINTKISNLTKDQSTLGEKAQQGIDDAKSIVDIIENTVDIGTSLIAYEPGTTTPTWAVGEEVTSIPASELPPGASSGWRSTRASNPALPKRPVKVSPSVTYRVTAWIKADDPGGAFLIGARSPQGSTEVVEYKTIKGPTGWWSGGSNSTSYVLQFRHAPTEWTEYEAHIKFNERAEYIWISGTTWSYHGSHTPTTHSIADLRIEPIIPSQAAVDKAQNDALQNHNDILKAQADINTAQGDINANNSAFQTWQLAINGRRDAWEKASTNATKALADLTTEQGKVLAIQTELNTKRDRWENGATLAINNLTDFSTRQTKWNKASTDATKALSDAAIAQKAFNDNQTKWNLASSNATKALADLTTEQGKVLALQSELNTKRDRWENGATLAIDNLTNFATRQDKWNKASTDATKALSDAAIAQKAFNDNQTKWNLASSNATKALSDLTTEQGKVLALQSELNTKRDRWENGATLAIDNLTNFATRQDKWNKASSNATKALEDAGKAQLSATSANTTALQGLTAASMLTFPHLNVAPHDSDGRPWWSVGMSVNGNFTPPGFPAGESYWTSSSSIVNVNPEALITVVPGIDYKVEFWYARVDAGTAGAYLDVRNESGNSALTHWANVTDGVPTEINWSARNYAGAGIGTSSAWERKVYLLRVRPGTEKMALHFRPGSTATANGTRVRFWGAHLSAFMPIQEQIDATQTAALASHAALFEGQNKWNEVASSAIQAQATLIAKQDRWSDGVNKALAWQDQLNNSQSDINKTTKSVLANQEKWNSAQAEINNSQSDTNKAVKSVLDNQEKWNLAQAEVNNAQSVTNKAVKLVNDNQAKWNTAVTQALNSHSELFTSTSQTFKAVKAVTDNQGKWNKVVSDLVTTNSAVSNANKTAIEGLTRVLGLTHSSSNIVPMVPGGVRTGGTDIAPVFTPMPAWMEPGGRKTVTTIPEFPSLLVAQETRNITRRSGDYFSEVDPTIEYKYSYWVHANVTGTRFYIEVLDQDGSFALASNTPDNHSSAGTYLAGNVLAAVGWRKNTGVIKFKPGVRAVKIGGIYYNHTNGVVGTQSLADIQIYPNMPSQTDVNKALVDSDAAQNTLLKKQDTWNDAASRSIATVENLWGKTAEDVGEINVLTEELGEKIQNQADDFAKNIAQLFTFIPRIAYAMDGQDVPASETDGFVKITRTKSGDRTTKVAVEAVGRWVGTMIVEGDHGQSNGQDRTFMNLTPIRLKLAVNSATRVFYLNRSTSVDHIGAVKVTFLVDPGQVVVLYPKGENFIPDRSEWTTLHTEVLSAAESTMHNLRLSATFSGTTYDDTYGVRIRVGNSVVVEQKKSKIGPLFPGQNGTRYMGVQKSQVHIPAGTRIYFEAYSTGRDYPIRRVSKWSSEISYITSGRE